jgi:hypothetical protein
MEDPGSVAVGNIDRVVGGTGVDDDDLVDDALKRSQAARKVAFFVPHDHDGREEWRTHDAPVMVPDRWVRRPS